MGRFKKTLAIIIVFFLLTLIGCGKERNIDGETAYSPNPDCGFYTPVYLRLYAGGMEGELEPYLTRNNLLHLRISIGDFSGKVNGAADTEISAAAIAALTAAFDALRENSVCAVVRFSYDVGFGGKANCEPSKETMLRHIEQTAQALSCYPDAVTAVEAGLIGPWGEMHTSAAATSENITAIAKAWLKAMPDSFILLRTPRMVADCLGINVSDLRYFTAVEGTDAARLGIFNDGFLGSDSDLGTYANREHEMEWLSRQTEKAPFGGEVVAGDDSLNSIDYAASELIRTHASYLNKAWNDTVLEKWKTTQYTAASGGDKDYYGLSAYVYVRDHLGYRFTLNETLFSDRVKTSFKLNLTVTSDGFGNLLKSKIARLVFIGENGEFAVDTDVDARQWKTGGKYKVKIKAALDNVPKGDYTLYLRLTDPLSDKYSVAFANVYDKEANANRLGSIRVN